MPQPRVYSPWTKETMAGLKQVMANSTDVDVATRWLHQQNDNIPVQVCQLAVINMVAGFWHKARLDVMEAVHDEVGLGWDQVAGATGFDTGASAMTHVKRNNGSWPNYNPARRYKLAPRKVRTIEDYDAVAGDDD